MDDDTEYITADAAAETLRISPRQVHRYGEGTNPRLRTRRAGRRLLFHAGDVVQLASDLDVAHRPRPRTPGVRIIPQNELVQYLEKRDQEIADLREEIGRLKATMQAQQALHEAELRLRLLEAEQHYQAQLQQQQQPEPPQLPAPRRSIWRRLLGGNTGDEDTA